jgi:neutral trehalase
VGGFDRGFDRENGSERDKPAELAAVGDGTVRGGEPRVAVETRTRGEAHADLRQAVESGWDRGQRFAAPRGELAVFQARRAGYRR